MAAKRRQFFFFWQRRSFFSNSAREAGTLRRQNARKSVTQNKTGSRAALEEKSQPIQRIYFNYSLISVIGR